MNRRLLVLFLPFVLALLVFLTMFIPATTAAGPDGVEEVNVTWPVDAAAISLNDNLFNPARLTGQNQSVFGPACTTGLGDPFSPISSTFRPPNHYTNPAFPAQYFTYRYRINIPDNYEAANNTSIVRVELFDPDTYNHSPGLTEIDTTFYTISHTQPYGPPSTISKQCPGSDQWRSEACVLTTDEPETYNPYWFVRLDEMRRNTGSSCVAPSTYSQSHHTQTAFQLYYYRTVSNTVETQRLGDYYGRADNLHDTDLRWVSPGGGLSYDQNVNVPANSGSFEVNLANLNNIVIDPATGTRTLYLDVTAFAGASENGYDVWAGPPTYTGPANPGNACQGGVPSKVNQRNLHITNCGNGAHSSGGVNIVALDYQPTNYNSTNPVTRKLVYIGPEYAGETVHVSLFDSDAGAQAPVVFYFDSLAFSLQIPPPPPPANPVNSSLTDWYLPFALNNTLTLDPDLQPGESRNCYPGTCNNTWITPTYRIQVPMLDPDLCVNPSSTPQYCTPFYGGWLTVRYLPGYHDTAAWQVELPEPPLVDTTTTCPGVFPVTMSDSVRSMTASDYLIAWNTPSIQRYPGTLPTYSSFLAHTPDVSLNEAEPGDIFLFVGEGGAIGNYGLLQWNTDPNCQGCNQGHIRLRNSMTWWGNVLDYTLGFHEIGDWNDTQLQVGDRVAISAAELAAVTGELAGHIDRGRTIQFMAWSETGVLIGGGPGGSDVDYARASQFVNFHILGFKAVGNFSERWILAEFIGRDTHCGQPGPTIGFAGSSYSVSETGEVVSLTVELGYALANTVTVSYTTGNGTATAGQDYAAASGLLTFPPGDTQATFLIPIHDDVLLEGDETFTVTLSSPVNGVITNTNPVTVTIVDDEVATQVSLSPTSVNPNENDGGLFIVYLNSLVPYTVTVDFNTSDGTAIHGQDFTAISYTVTFPPWGSAEFIPMMIVDDTLLEGPETFFATLSNPTPPGVTISGTNPITITILDDEQPAQIGFAAATVTVPENSGNAQVVIQQNQAHTSPLQVNVTTSDVTATGGADYIVISDVITHIPQGKRGAKNNFEVCWQA